MASASALIATMAVATAPTAAFAAESCQPTGFVRDGISLTAARVGGTVTGTVDASACNIGVYIDATHPGSVRNADVSGANYYGVVVNGASATVTDSKVHQIGEPQLDGTQHGRAITYINGASGTISGNQVYDFQKNGIEVINLAADGVAPSSAQTSATVKNNVVTGEDHIDWIAQNGIVVRDGANAAVKNNTVSGFYYTPTGTEATGLLLYQNAAGTVTASANKFADNEVDMYGLTANKGGHVKP
jgi:hypothetical protein